MLMHSRRRLRVNGVVVDASHDEFLFPEGTFAQLNVVVIGAMIFARVGKNESLSWPPQTLVAEYGLEFLNDSGTLGYAKMVSLNGLLTKVYVIKSAADHELASHLLRQLHGLLIEKFHHWLLLEVHPKDATWPTTVKRLDHAVAEFASGEIALEALVKRFEKVFATLGSHHQQRGSHLIQSVWALAAKYDRQLAAHFKVVYLLRDVQRVTYSNYGDVRDQVVTNTATDLINVEVAWQQSVAQIKQQQDQFQTEQLPFYEPKWLQAQQEAGHLIWPISQLIAYQQGGL